MFWRTIDLFAYVQDRSLHAMIDRRIIFNAIRYYYRLHDNYKRARNACAGKKYTELNDTATFCND